MIKYCANCGRSIPIDSRVCPYCGKPVPFHEAAVAPEPTQKKDDKTVLIVVVVVVLLLVVPIAIAATVYVYVSGMIGQMGSHSYFSTPTIFCTQNITQKTLTVSTAYSFYSSSIPWADIEIQGSCNTSELGTYVTVGDTITNCLGYIRMTYIPTNTQIDSWTFT